MTTTLDLNRLDNVTKPSNFTDKFIVSQNGEVQFVDDEDLVYVFSSSNIVTGFCITGVSGNNFTKIDGKVISPEVNGKQYILNITGNNMNYTKNSTEILSNIFDKTQNSIASVTIRDENNTPYIEEIFKIITIE